jgi:nicotinic acid phosphoribosyltransferase
VRLATGKSVAEVLPSARKRSPLGALRSSALADALEQPRLSGRVRVSIGWGTLLTNDFRGPAEGDALAPFAMVCKAVSANERPTAKRSDNPEKAVGPEAEIARYKRVFGVGEQERLEVVDG